MLYGRGVHVKQCKKTALDRQNHCQVFVKCRFTLYKRFPSSSSISIVVPCITSFSSLVGTARMMSMLILQIPSKTIGITEKRHLALFASPALFAAQWQRTDGALKKDINISPFLAAQDARHFHFAFWKQASLVIDEYCERCWLVLKNTLGHRCQTRIKVSWGVNLSN